MLTALKVQNLAIIENIAIGFDRGFTVLTGETGAGKSLLVDALSLALGARADADLIRTGEARALVELEFNCSRCPEILDRAKELSIVVESPNLKITREVSITGRSTSRINGQLVTLSDLRELSRLMIDLHGQNNHQALLDARQHIDFFDAWIGEPIQGIKREVHESYRVLNEAKRRLESIRKGRRDWERRLDTLRYEIKEINAVSPVIGEYESLAINLARLQHSEKLAQLFISASAALADEEMGAENQVARAISELLSASKYDPTLLELSESLQECQYMIQEAIHSIHDFQEELESNPTLLEDTAHRLDQLKMLRRKYGDDETEILNHLQSAMQELADLESYDGDEDALLEKVDHLTEIYEEHAETLSQQRKEFSPAFSGEVRNHLQDLALEQAEFEVSISHGEPLPSGTDRVEFYFTANPGEALKPLNKVASGGEMSRTMLALKASLAGRAGVPTLIFDEVDTGLSGKAAIR